MTGVPLLITFVIAIVVMILAISKLKLHPFLAIMGVALLLAIIVGIPLADIPGTIGAGFSGTFSSIGIVIILGAMIAGGIVISGLFTILALNKFINMKSNKIYLY